MLFRMTCAKEDGDVEIWHYENTQNVIYAPNGEVFKTNGDAILRTFTNGRREKRKPVTSNKSADLRVLRIQLGLKCNMNCSYCSQGKVTAVSASPKDVDNIIQSLKRNNIKVHSTIEFWGGEPLVYWKTLRLLIPALRKEYPHVNFKIVTNGTLLTREKVDFLKELGVVLVCSHDGIGYSMRGEDPLKDEKILDAWRYANEQMKFSINCVINPANADVCGIVPFFKRLFGEDIHVNIEGPMTHTGITSEDIMFSEKARDLMHSSMIVGLLKRDPGVWSLFYGRLAMQIMDLCQQTHVEPYLPRCSAWQPNSLVINAKGDVIKCHNYGDKSDYIGHIDNLDEVNANAVMTGWNERELCSRCHVVGACKGGCPVSNGLGWSMTCKNLKAFHTAIFEVAWLLVTRRHLIKVELEENI